ncbi:unnamed protein product [Paramecium octaurelia]|uniref:Uncharacterized protein n=1 Tax=Paramecium octaurelia TaxID=43137 RepID=A0A8S1YBY3_PAROT|nr:unnamed protein product [Paramecium octaurelia]
MVHSNDQQFQLRFIDPYRRVKGKQYEYQHIMTPEGICIVGQVDQHFIMLIEHNNKTEVMGIKIIVDGYTLPGRKTFKGKCRIQGFPNSDGNINCFKFAKPKADPDSTNIFKRNLYRPPWDLEQNDMRNYTGGPGEIIVKIYETVQKQNKYYNSGGCDYRTNEPMFVEVTKNDNKEAEDQCLGIAIGNVIEIQPRPYKEERRYRDIIKYDCIVQSFRVIYMDSSSLVSKGFIQLSCHTHIRYLTEEYFLDNEPAMIQVLQTLIESGQKDKEENEIFQEAKILVERLDYYFQGELLNIFMSKENQEQFQLNAALRIQYIEGELIKFMNGWPEFFTNLDTKMFGIKQRFNQQIYLETIENQIHIELI